MMRKSSIGLLLLFVFILSCAFLPSLPKTYEVNFINETGLVSHVAIGLLEDGVPTFIEEHMLGVVETWTVNLPSGHYHFMASATCGFTEICIKIPEMLQYPDKPVNVHLTCGNNPLRGT